MSWERMVGYLSPMGDYFKADTVARHARRYLCTHYLIFRREECPYIRLAQEECVAAGACIGGGHAVVE